MSAHTPGPWSVYEDEDEPTLVVGHEKMPSYHIPLWGRVLSETPPTEEDRANARLIAAAPDMLDALKAYIAADESGDHDSFVNAYEGARAAIAKAEGET